MPNKIIPLLIILTISTVFISCNGRKMPEKQFQRESKKEYIKCK